MEENITRTLEPDAPWPVGVWVRLSLSNYPNAIWFTYVDPQAGFSAATDFLKGLESSPEHCIARLPQQGVTCEPLSDEEILGLSLPAKPDWLRHYGPQPPPGTLYGTWRTDQRLKGKFHPEYPDDIQVLVHEGGPYIAKHPPEVMWVRVTGSQEGIFLGIILNQPYGLSNITEGSIIKFMMPSGGEHPILVTDKYLEERDRWLIHPCDKCGLTELFDAPSDYFRVMFPNVPEDEITVSFTSRCGACGEGHQVVENKEAKGEKEFLSPQNAAKRWWQFWK